MASLSLRLTASSDDTATLINRISMIEGVESVEEIADLMPHMDDPDSSSAGLPDDIGPGSHLVQVETTDEASARRALDAAKDGARRLGIALETEDDAL